MSNAEGKTVKVTIDGREIQVPAGINVIQAAARLGIYIPHYCYHPALSVAGNCRLCLVEIEGMPKPVIACNQPVSDGMSVRTNSKLVQDCRAGMMEFLLINHPLDCPICDRGGECMLQRYSMDYGTGHARLRDEKVFFKKEDFDPVIDLERNRCILCTRCVRMCDEIFEESALGVFQRGDHSYIATFDNKPIESIFSGNVVETCPVGALTSKPYRFKARPWELHQTQSTCSLCASGCPVTYWSRDGYVYRTTPRNRQRRNEYVINEDNCEFICNVGRYGSDYMNRRDQRIQKPLVRENERFRTATWNEAAHTIANRIQTIIERYGGEAVGVWVSPNLTNEELFSVQAFTRNMLKSNNLDWRGAWGDTQSTDLVSAAMLAAEGYLDKPSDYGLILCLSGSLQHQLPVTALRIKEAARRKSVKLAAISERIDTWLGRHAAYTSLRGPEETAAALRALSKGEAGADASLKPLADLMADSPVTLVVWNLEGHTGRDASLLTPAVLELKASLGEKIHLLPLVSSRNAAGAFILGCEPDRRPGGKADATPGLSLPAMIDAAAGGSLKALFVFGSDVIERMPVSSDAFLRALQQLELLVVSDIFPTPLHDFAHLVLPARTTFEKEGSMINIEGGLLWFERGEKRPPVDARDARETVFLLGEAMGHPVEAKDERTVLRELMRLLLPSEQSPESRLFEPVPGDEAPIRYALHERDDIIPQLARTRYETVPDLTPPVRVRLGGHTDHSPTAISTATPTPRTTGTDEELLLCGEWDIRGDDLWLNYSETMPKIRPEAWVEIAPADAARLGICNGDQVEIAAEGVHFTVKSIVSSGVAPGVIYAPLNLLGVGIEPLVVGHQIPRVTVTKAEVKTSTPH